MSERIEQGWRSYSIKGPKGWFAQAIAPDGGFGESDVGMRSEPDAVEQAKSRALKRKSKS